MNTLFNVAWILAFFGCLARVLYLTPRAIRSELQKQQKSEKILLNNRVLCTLSDFKLTFWRVLPQYIAEANFTSNSRLKFPQIISILQEIECGIKVAYFNRNQLTENEAKIVEAHKLIGEIRFKNDGEETTQEIQRV